MKQLFAALIVLGLVLGAAGIVAPANAAAVTVFAPNEYEGANN